MSTFTKKLLAIFSAMALMFTASVSAFAAEQPEVPAVIAEGADLQNAPDAIGGTEDPGTDPALTFETGDSYAAYADDPAGTSIDINETNFPDANFRTYVSDNIDGIDGSSKDGKLSETEISKVEEIDISSKSIGNLKGIEYFTNLKKLDCHS
ncbi:MAG: hypothetical protein J6X60_00660, partial [Ruminiclostridium sp.]|nr:hypothetical protein [Ruminiclostridium sp.]